MRTLLTGLLTLVPLCTFASPEVIYRDPQSFGELSRENLAMTLLPVHLTASSSNLGSRNEAHMRYAVVIEKAAKNFAAYVPDLPGCVATGATLKETEQLIREAIELHLSGLRDDGAPIPQPSSQVDYVDVAA